MKRYRMDIGTQHGCAPVCELIEDPKGNLLKYDEIQTLLKDIGQVLSLLGSREVEVDIDGNDLNIRLKAVKGD